MFTMALAARAVADWAGGGRGRRARLQVHQARSSSPTTTRASRSRSPAPSRRRGRVGHDRAARSPAAARRCWACPGRSCVPERPRRPHHTAPRRPGDDVRHGHHRGRAGRRGLRRRCGRRAGARARRRQQPGRRRRRASPGTVVKVATRGVTPTSTGTTPPAAACSSRSRPARAGTTWSPRAVDRGLGRGRGAVRDPRLRRRHARSRTSAPTARRSPRRSRRSGCWDRG